MLSKEEELLKERIKHIFGTKRLNMTKFAGGNDSDRTKFSKQINGAGGVPYNTIYRILYMFPDISADWLIMGEGSMYKIDHLAPKIYNHNEVHGSTAGGDINVGSRTVPVPQNIDTVKVQDMQAAMAAQAKRIEELEKDKELLQGLLSAFTAGAKSKV